MNFVPRRYLAVAIALFMVLSGLALNAPAGYANGVPMRVTLSYLQGVSNFGPTTATGQAELSYSEGILNLTAAGLAPLSGDRYGVWLVKSASNKALSAGLFATDASGNASFNGKLGTLNSYDYDLIILTVQPGGAPGEAPGAQRSIGGFFTPVQAPQVATPGTSTETQPGKLPATLPLTGDPPTAVPGRVLPFSRHQSAILLILAGAGMLALTILRGKRRRA